MIPFDTIRTFSIYTLGCRLNQADSALCADRLVAAGLEFRAWPDAADLIIINSCTVTGTAAAKTRQAVRAARRRQPDAVIIVLGCDVDNDIAAWGSMDAADAVFGNAAKQDIVRALREEWPDDRVEKAPYRTPGREEMFTEAGVGIYEGRTRANLKIQEGCDFHCSYCIVPKVRGPARSREWDDIRREAHGLMERGYREITLTGVNIATYRSGSRNLSDLTAVLLAECHDVRIRLSSTEPGPVIRDILDLMRTEPRLCRFLHLPLQHGDNDILSAMNRRYSRETYADLVTAAVTEIPGVCIGSDVIVGFPGETGSHFNSCADFIRMLPLSYLHVFTFSPRSGTPATDLPGRVSRKVSEERSAVLRRIAVEKQDVFAASQLGKRVQVLTETRNDDGNWEGWSDNYLRVEIAADGDGSLRHNQFVDVTVGATLGERHVRGVTQHA